MPELVARKREIARRRRWRRWRLAASVALVVATGIGITLYMATRPERIRALVEAAIRRRVHATVSFSERIEVSWRHGVTLYHFSLAPPGPSGGESPGAVLWARRVVLASSFTDLLLGRFRLSGILFDRPVVRVLRGEKGDWSFEGVAFRGHSGGVPGQVPRVRVVAGAVHYCDNFTKGRPLRQDLLDINGAVEVSRDGDFEFKGTARTPFLDHVEVEGRLDRSAKTVELDVRAARFNISGEDVHLLGRDVAALHRQLNPHGFVDLAGKCRFDPETGLSHAGITGTLLDCHLQPPGFPVPLERVSGAFEMDDRTLRLKGIEGDLGAGTFRCSGSIDWSPGWKKVEAVQISAAASALPLDARVRAWLPGHIRDHFDRLKLRGTVAIEGKVEATHLPIALEDVTLGLTLDGLEWTYRDVPYAFGRTRGKVSIAHGEFEIVESITAWHDDVRLEVRGEGDLAADGAVHLVGVVDNLPLQSALRNAMAPGSLLVWDLFRPSGTIRLDISHRRSPGQREAETYAVVTCRDVSIQYEWFPYAIREITGEAILDFRQHKLILRDVQGVHGGQVITAVGHFELGGDRGYDVHLHAEALELDGDLRSALPPGTRGLFEEFGFSGRGEVDVKIASRSGSDPGVDVTVGLHHGDILFEHFALPVRLCGGQIRFTGEQAFSFTDLQTAPDATPRFSLSGEVVTTGGGRILDYDVEITDLPVDGDFRQALPDDLARVVERLGLRCTLGGHVTGSYAYNINDASSGRAQYHARDLTLRDGSLDFGLAMKDLEGEGEFIGKKDPESSHMLGGRVRMRGARFNRLRLGPADILFAHGKEHPGIRRAMVGRTLEETDFLPAPKLITRLSSGKVAETFQAQVLHGDLYDGRLQGFLYVDVGQRRDFGGEYVIDGLQLASAAGDVFDLEGKSLAGSCRGAVSFGGATGSSGSVQGHGEMHVKDARLADLPLFVGLFGILFLKPTVDPHFNEVDVTFDIHEGKFWAPVPDGLAISGDSINLLGAGSMDFDGDLDLVLEPSFLPFDVPLLQNVLDLFKKAVVTVFVQGKLEAPEVKMGTIGGLLRVPVGGGKAPEKTGERR